MPDIEFATSVGTVPGYLATPAAERGPATVVLQERCGLDDHIRSVCDRFASEGLFALAPDLCHGESAAQPSQADQTVVALSIDQAKQDVRAAVELLASEACEEGQGVGAVGFCLGGGLAVCAAATCPQIAAAVTYYHEMPDGKTDLTRINGPILGHFGTADGFITLKAAKALELELRTAGIDVIFDKYTGAGHGFFDDTDRLGTYDAQAAQRSWDRTIGFLRTELTTARPSRTRV